MTYKLNPEIRKITSLVELVFPDGEKRQFENGVEACSAVIENRYVVRELRAVEGTVVIILQNADETDWIKEQTEKTGVEPNLFDGV